MFILSFLFISVGRTTHESYRKSRRCLPSGSRMFQPTDMLLSYHMIRLAVTCRRRPLTVGRPGSAGPPPPPPNGSSSPSLWCGVVVGCFPLPVVVSCGWGVGLLRLVPPLPPVVWCGFGFPAWVCLACEPSCGKKRAQSHRFGLGSVGGGGIPWGGGGSVNREPGSLSTYLSIYIHVAT